MNGTKIGSFSCPAAAEASRPPKKASAFTAWRAVGRDRRDLILATFGAVMRFHRLVLLWALVAISAMLPAMAQAQYTYTTNTGTITIETYTGSADVVTFPDTLDGLPVTRIQGYACCPGFCLSTNLTSVTIGTNVTSMDEPAFFACPTLTTIVVDPRNPCFSSADGVLYNKDKTILIQCPRGKTGTFVLPCNVTNIGESAFFACDRLSAITVDPGNPCYSSVDGVLYNKKQTALILCPMGRTGNCTIPNGVTNIADGAFYQCANVTSVTIPDSVTSIGGRAFNQCMELKAVYFKGDAPTCGSDVFVSWDKPTIYYSSGNTGWGTTFGGRPTALWDPRAQK